jgi:hypothetical protein
MLGEISDFEQRHGDFYFVPAKVFTTKARRTRRFGKQVSSFVRFVAFVVRYPFRFLDLLRFLRPFFFSVAASPHYVFCG